MAKVPNYKDIYTRWPEHPRYNSRQIIEDDLIEVIVQKLEMVLFTNKGEVFGDLDFGASLETYLWETNLSNLNLEQVIYEQIDKYIPELNDIEFDFDLEMFEGTLRDIMILNFVIKGYNVRFIYA